MSTITLLGGNMYTDIIIGGIDWRDYPDFSDAYVESACWSDGRLLTDSELDELTDTLRETGVIYQYISEEHF